MADTAVADEKVIDPASPADAAVAASQDATATPSDKPATLVTEPAKPAETTDPAKPAEVVYDLKLPDDSSLDATVTERMTAIARESGLSPEAAQKQLDFVNSEVVNAKKAFLESNSPGGADWTRQVTEWETEAKKNPEFGGTPEKFDATVASARKVLSDYGTPELNDWLTQTGFGSHPMVLRLLSNIAKATSEGEVIPNDNKPAPKAKSDAEVLYDHPSNYTNKQESDA